jgi:transcriptional regulator with XRE-family HTH domain
MFANQLKKLCDEHGESLRQLAFAIGVDPSTASGWNRGSEPRKPTLKKIADHFGVTVDWLLSDEDLPSPHAPVVESDAFLPLSSREKQILEMYRDLSEMGRLTVDTTILRVWNDER